MKDLNKWKKKNSVMSKEHVGAGIAGGGVDWEPGKSI